MNMDLRWTQADPLQKFEAELIGSVISELRSEVKGQQDS